MMSAVIAREPGGPEVLQMVQRPVPIPQAGEVLIRVAAAGVNRPDLMQRNGLPTPPGNTDVLGLEAAGIVVAVGSGVHEFAPGDRVMPLLNGGGYAEYCLALVAQCLPVPMGLSLHNAAGIPEAAFGVWHHLFELGRLRSGDSVLIHGAASGVGSGVGSFAVQCAHSAGARVIATAGGPKKYEMLQALRVWRAVDRHREDFVEVVNHCTEGRGVDVVLDNIGGPYVARNLAVMAMGERRRHRDQCRWAELQLGADPRCAADLRRPNRRSAYKQHLEARKLSASILCVQGRHRCHRWVGGAGLSTSTDSSGRIASS